MKRRILIALLAGLASAAHAQNKVPSEELLAAVQEGNGSKMVSLIDSGGKTIINTRGYDGTTALTTAVRNRNLGFVNYLLSSGADPDVATRDGITPLLIATQLRWDEGASALLQARAKPDAANRKGETPLVVAVQMRHAPMVRRLLEYGANPDKTDFVAGYSARDYAKRDTRSRDLLRLIENARPKSGSTAN